MNSDTTPTDAAQPERLLWDSKADTGWGELGQLDDEECRNLLRRNTTGRLAVNAGDGPVVFPVRYRFEDDAIIIRTGLGDELYAAAMHQVTVEIDDVSSDSDWGWSVLAHGQAFDITTSIDRVSVDQRRLNVPTWAPGINDHRLKINVWRLSGRRFGAAPMSGEVGTVQVDMSEDNREPPLKEKVPR